MKTLSAAELDPFVVTFKFVIHRELYQIKQTYIEFLLAAWMIIQKLNVHN